MSNSCNKENEINESEFILMSLLLMIPATRNQYFLLTQCSVKQ